MHNINISFIFGGLSLLLSACSNPPATDSPPPTNGTTQLHVTAAVHLEPSANYAKCEPKGYFQIRAAVVAFIRAAVERGASLHLQSDDTFFIGMANCEDQADQSDSDNMPLGAWLETQPNVFVDAHKEGGNEENPEGTGPDNTLYADVHALASRVVKTSDVVGGFIWQNKEQLARLLDEGGMAGVDPQSPVWQPKILSLAVGQDHHTSDFSQDDMSSGVWRPSGANSDFYVPASSGLPYVGPGLQHADWSGKCADGFRGPADYAEAVLSLVDDGTLPAGLYTAGLAIPQSAVKADPNAPNSRFQQALAFIDAVNTLRKSDNRVVWSSYDQVVAAWEGDFDGVAQTVRYAQIPSALYSCQNP